MKTALHKRFCPNTKSKNLPALNRNTCAEFMKMMYPWEEIILETPNKDKAKKEIEEIVNDVKKETPTNTNKGGLVTDFPQRKMINVEIYDWNLGIGVTPKQIELMKDLSRHLINNASSTDLMKPISVIKFNNIFFYHHGRLLCNDIPVDAKEFEDFLNEKTFPAYHEVDKNNTNAQAWFKHHAKQIIREKVHSHKLYIFEYRVLYDNEESKIDVLEAITYG